ncbi:MAG TPA: FkbM family methyltransferase, partial [Oculatellaceae cyanobacterium]
VFVFEPLPRNLNYLRKHLDLNKINNVTVIEAAISDKDGLASFDNGVCGEMAHIASSGQLQVRTYTLDHLLELGKIPVPDLIKMDIEGAEFMALWGARSMLAKAQPTIFLATHGAIVHRECCRFLKSLGYQLTPIDGNPLDNSREIIAMH